MTQQRQTPEHTSTLAFEQYTASKPILSSVDAGWQHLIVRSFIEPQTLDRLVVPAVPDPHISLQLSGSMHMEVREIGGSWSSFQVQAGHLFFTPGGGSPYELRWVSESKEPIESVHLHLDAQFLAKTAEEAALDPTRIELLERSTLRDPLIEQISLMLKQELANGGLAGKLYAETAAQLLAVHLLREHCTIEHRIKGYSGGLPKDRLRRITDYIEAHLDTDLSLDDLAGQISMSTYHFARLFKQSTGESPNQYVTRLRIEKTKQLLQETNLGVLDIALAVGYNSPSHLATQFKRLTGVSPSAYRRTR